MKSKVLITLMCAWVTLYSGLSFSANNSLIVELEIPRMNVAEYHKPYVAVWLEDASRKSTQLGLWYDLDMKDNEGKKWLKDIRQWWRRVGRKSQQPFDGLTSATKGPGTHPISIDLNSSHLNELVPGNYQLRIEASREVGGKEVVNIPFSWPPQANNFPLIASGSKELGSVTVQLQ